MGKRRQHQNHAVTDSSGQLEVVETERSTDVQKNICQHLGKAVELIHIKKSIKSENLKTLSCSICSKVGKTPEKEDNWICLQCGFRQCSLEHLKTHFNVPHSDLHAIAFSLNNFTVWCDPCNCELREEDNRKLKICVAFIKQTMEKSKQVQIVETPYDDDDDDVPPPLIEWNEVDCAKSNILKKKPTFQRPSVRGLTNLGNTCFFNSVLQCLARTPKLVDVLRRMESEEEYISITLKNGQRLEGILGKSGDWLGPCLADTLVALCRPGETSSENPLKLLQLLRKKCPQFEGYDQHDAHELLRHLLDNVRQNDLKRYRSLMLSELGLSRKVNPQDVSPDLQKKVKSLDNEVVERVTLVPEHVFKGLLVSTLECQECRHTSHCVESFLDLSLPIMADKPQPPSIIRRKGSTSPELVDEKVGGGMSKYQLKKQAKQAKKKARNKHGQKSVVIAPADGMSASLDSHSDKGESEADVEDNEEDKPHESGYSSEKIQSESSSLSGGDDSARTSPTTHVKDECGSQPSARTSVCEGLPTVGGCGGPQLQSTVIEQQSQSYVPFPRVRRRPPGKWIGVGGSLSPSWTPHEESIHIPDAAQVMASSENWKNYVPRQGNSPNTGRAKKDSRLTSIIEESDRPKPSDNYKSSGETSVSDQVTLMSKVVETMLAQVHISQLDLERVENTTVTDITNNVDVACQVNIGEGDCIVRQDNRVEEDNSLDCTIKEDGSSKVARFNPFNNVDNKENSQNDDRNNTDNSVDRQNTIDIRQDVANNPTSEIKNIPCSDIKESKPIEDPSENKVEIKSEINSTTNEQISPNSATDETSNGFYIDSLYDQPNENTEEKVDQKKGSEEDKEESVEIKPILDYFKRDNNRKTEKKEDGEYVKFRRRARERETSVKTPDTDSECSVQSCLSQFTAVEIMSGANRVGCSACTTRHNKGNKEGKTVDTIASKQLLIKGAPQVLILHLKRFQVQMYAFRKLSKHVSFPIYLDLAPFCLQEVERDEDGKILYSLYGVVEHSGNLNGGHYVAYVKVDDEEPCRWFCISDSYVHEVSESRVLSSQAYLLFYRRIYPTS